MSDLKFPPQPVRKTEAADPDRQPKARAKLKKDGNKQKIACNLIKNVIKSNSCAEMAEWSNAHDSKSCYVGTRTGVRIPLSAPRSGGFGLPFCVAQREHKKARGSGFGASRALPWLRAKRGNGSISLCARFTDNPIKSVTLGRLRPPFLRGAERA